MNRIAPILILPAIAFSFLISTNCLVFAADTNSAKLNQGIQAFEGKRYHEAEDLFSAAVAASPADQKAHLMLARTYEMLLDPKSALREYDNCVKVNPFSPLGRSAKAESLNMAGNSASQAARPVDDVKTVRSTVDRINQEANDLKALHGHNTPSYSTAAGIGTASSGAFNQNAARNTIGVMGAVGLGSQFSTHNDHISRHKMPNSYYSSSGNTNLNNNYYGANSTTYNPYNNAYNPNLSSASYSPYNNSYNQNPGSASFNPYNNSYNQNPGSASFNPYNNSYNQNSGNASFNPYNNSYNQNTGSASFNPYNSAYNQNSSGTYNPYNNGYTPNTSNVSFNPSSSYYNSNSSITWGTNNSSGNPSNMSAINQMRQRNWNPAMGQQTAYNYSSAAAADAQVQAMRRQQADAQAALSTQESANNLERLMGENKSSGSPRLRALGTNLFVRYYGTHNQDGSEVSTPPADPVQELKAREMSLTDMSGKGQHINNKPGR